MTGDQSLASQRQTYRRLMLQKAVDLSKEHGGLRKIPAKILEENGIGLSVKKGTVRVLIRLPGTEIMEKRIAQFQPVENPAQKELESFKLSPEPPPRAVAQRPATMEDFWIEQGWYKLDKNGWRLIRAKWKERDDVRAEAIRFMVDRVLQKDPREVTQEDFNSNRLGGLLVGYFSSSPHAAISEAYPKLDIKPWEMANTPLGFFGEKENRVAAIRWLVEKLQKNPRDICYDDFISNRLRGLIVTCGESAYQAICEAYPEQAIKPWEMAATPRGFYEEEGNRILAVKWLIEKLGKDVREITGTDFSSNRLGGLIAIYFGSSPYNAICATSPNPELHPWEMAATPRGFYEKKKNRVAAVRWLAEKLNKDPQNLLRSDFDTNGLGGLLVGHYLGSPFEAISEAFTELNIKPWERGVTRRGHFQEKENRTNAVKWLIERIGKDPRDVGVDDFHSNGLTGLLEHYGSSPYAAISEAFPELELNPWEMLHTPTKFFNEQENRIAAVKWLVDKLGKDPRDVTQQDFISNRLSGLLSNHYNHSPYEALLDSGLVEERDERYMRTRNR